VKVIPGVSASRIQDLVASVTTVVGATSEILLPRLSCLNNNSQFHTTCCTMKTRWNFCNEKLAEFCAVAPCPSREWNGGSKSTYAVKKTVEGEKQDLTSKYHTCAAAGRRLSTFNASSCRQEIPTVQTSVHGREPHEVIPG
jgi:hypothetical protein